MCLYGPPISLGRNYHWFRFFSHKFELLFLSFSASHESIPRFELHKNINRIINFVKPALPCCFIIKAFKLLCINLLAFELKHLICVQFCNVWSNNLVSIINTFRDVAVGIARETHRLYHVCLTRAYILMLSLLITQIFIYCFNIASSNLSKMSRPFRVVVSVCTGFTCFRFCDIKNLYRLHTCDSQDKYTLLP
jgi:hypothetical protein